MTLEDLDDFAGRIGVITGGLSRERDRSLLSGSTVQAALEEEGFATVSIDTAHPDFISQIQEVEIAFLAIAGKYGEDGKLQGLLETLGIPYTGSGVLASAIGMNKPMTKALAAAAGVPVAPHMLLDQDHDPADCAERVASRLGLPVVIKPVDEGGSVAVSLARTPQELLAALENRGDGEKLFAEQYVEGTAVTVGVLTIASATHALPVLGIESKTGFYDWASKRQPSLHRYECPAPLSRATSEALQTHAQTIHELLQCTSHSRSDFIVSADEKIYFLEVNTLPGLSRDGNLATMAKAAGITYEALIRHLLASAMQRPSYVP